MTLGTIAVPTVTAAIELAIADGASSDRLWSLAQVDENRRYDPEQRVSGETLFAVFAAIMRELRVPGWPIRYAQTMSVDAYQALGLACKTAKNVREGLLRASRFGVLWTDTSRWVLDERRDTAVLEFVRATERSLGVRCATEAAVGEMVQSMRDVLGARFVPTSVGFKHRAPDDVREHEAFFGCPVRFDAGIDGLELSPELLDRPNDRADAAIAAFFETYLESRLQALRSEPTLEAKLRELIAPTLSEGVPRAVDVARKLGLSERTMSRRLAAAGTSFGEVVERTRKELAERLLTQGDYRVGEVAFLLGFSETSAFSRAFKRWTGRSPAEYRRLA